MSGSPISQSIRCINSTSSSPESPDAVLTHHQQGYITSGSKSGLPAEHIELSMQKHKKDFYQHTINGSVHSSSDVNPRNYMSTKKSFCIDALLSKKQSDDDEELSDRQTNQHPTTFITTEEALRQFNENKRDYMHSPDDEISRFVITIIKDYCY